MNNMVQKFLKKIFQRSTLQSPRDGYGKGVMEAGTDDARVVVLCADLSESTRSLEFQQKFPDRFVEMGVAEQNMAGVAAGLALAGKIPFMASYAVFSPGRNWDQIRVSICYTKANVKIIGAHAGISVGADGATHQGLEDLAITRVLPNLTVIAPADATEVRKAVLAAAKFRGPVYIRFGREPVPVVTSKDWPFQIGKASVMREGKDVTIVSCGPMVSESLDAAKILAKRNISAEVLNMSTIKPLDQKTLLVSVRKTKAVVTAEEHQIIGGLGSAVAETLCEQYPVPMIRVGMPDCFGQSGPPQELLQRYGMTSDAIVQAAEKVFRKKNH